MKIYLGLGSNLGDRRENLRRAIALLAERGLGDMRVSPVVESPALLPPLAPATWNRPFLNLVLEGRVAAGSVHEWLRATKDIQDLVGRVDRSRWAPRLIDIDLLLWGEEIVAGAGLTVPHPEMHRRAFVLSPLLHLRPDLKIPGLGPRTALEWSRELPHHIPLWMGVVNLTPDSFSDGGRCPDWPATERLVEEMIGAGVHFIDVGAESTRPGATEVSPDLEWGRLAPVLERLRERLGNDPLRPLLSVDTRHPQVAERALSLGADLINDVSGLSSDAMLALARDSRKPWVAMHHLSVPADAALTLPEDRDPCDEVEVWLLRQLERWDRAGLDLGQIVFDPGIGFGKSSLQSLELLRHAGRFRRHGLRVLVGHSRKSFLKDFGGIPPGGRDLETIGASLSLCAKGVDILRVHDVPGHQRAYLAWAHLDA